MDDSKEPEMYQVVVNNMPAGSIAMVAMDKSAELFEDVYPNTAEQLKNGSYVDDLGVVEESSEPLRERTRDADDVELGNITEKLMANEEELEKVLGIKWAPPR